LVSRVTKTKITHNLTGIRNEIEDGGH